METQTAQTGDGKVQVGIRLEPEIDAMWERLASDDRRQKSAFLSCLIEEEAKRRGLMNPQSASQAA